MKREATLILIAILVITLGVAILLWAPQWRIGNKQPDTQSAAGEFNSERAYQDVLQQVSFGPRTPGSAGHEKSRAWMISEFEQAGWQVEVQQEISMGHTLYNIVAKNSQLAPVILLGTHYDTRFHADEDPLSENRTLPVPGANDGASGVAVLLELARTLPEDSIPVWLVLFDAEDNGNIEGWDWILGSTAFVSTLDTQPQAVVIVDMIGDADLNIHAEYSSDPNLTAEIWGVAAQSGFESYFIPSVKYHILDDHTPFIRANIPAVLIIDFDYPYWHTIADTPDKVSAKSLEIVGQTLLNWLENKK